MERLGSLVDGLGLSVVRAIEQFVPAAGALDRSAGVIGWGLLVLVGALVVVCALSVGRGR